MKFYCDWEKISPETKGLLKGVQNTVLAIVPGAEIILFGSSVRGDGDSGSDWNFLILIDQTLDRNLIVKITDHLYKVGSEAGIPLGSIIMTREKWNSPQYPDPSFKRLIEKEGILL